MPKLNTVLPSSEPDPATLKRLAAINRACLVLVGVIAIVCIAARLNPVLSSLHSNGSPFMRSESALAAFLCALSLAFSSQNYSRRSHRFSILLAVIVGLFGIATLIDARNHPSFSLLALLPAALRASGSTAPLNAAVFALLAPSFILIRAKTRFTIIAADLLCFCLAFLVLILVSGYVFATTPLFGVSSRFVTSPQTLICFLLLTIVVLVRRAQRGVLAIFFSRGLGANIARILSPILILIPFARESLRAHFANTGRLPAHYATAVLASLAATLSLCLLLYLAWRINAMETEIHELSLRDELTGLYNLRGFHILADQSLRLAQRSRLPFSVLFVDVDNLKEINDNLGHSAGSAFLVEAAEMLSSTFRETDVLARVGGDEFAVAGQLNQDAMAQAAERLTDSALLRNAGAGDPFQLNFSLGFVTSESDHWDSLDVLLAKADQMMYNEKRRKKLQVR